MMDLPELIVLDVGHGNCALLRDTDAVTVIDCPPPATTLVETLEVLDINVIDHILISHADIDHAGGLPTLLSKIRVRNVHINPDASKRGPRWVEIRTALALHNKLGTKVHRVLGTEVSKEINSGQVEIEILAPSLEEGLSGASGEDRKRRKLESNSVSAVIGLIHNSHRVVLLPGDLDEVGLENLLMDQENIEAHIPQFRERKNRIVNTPDQAGEESVDAELATPGPAFGSRNLCGCARDQCPQNIEKSSASWDEWWVY